MSAELVPLFTRSLLLLFFLVVTIMPNDILYFSSSTLPHTKYLGNTAWFTEICISTARLRNTSSEIKMLAEKDAPAHVTIQRH